jgi:hypothetical protein
MTTPHRRLEQNGRPLLLRATSGSELAGRTERHEIKSLRDATKVEISSC